MLLNSHAQQLWLEFSPCNTTFNFICFLLFFVKCRFPIDEVVMVVVATVNSYPLNLGFKLFHGFYVG